MSGDTTAGSQDVELTIRCAFQTAPDQAIQAKLNWTIKKLKDHLHNVYPTHPTVTSQRLIYAGGCLTDEQILGDIFDNARRVSESGDDDAPKILHLVCPLPQASPELRQRRGNVEPSSVPTPQPAPSTAQSFPQATPFVGPMHSNMSPEHAAAYSQYYQNYYNYMVQYQAHMMASFHSMQAASSSLNLPHQVFVQNGLGVPVAPYIPGQGNAPVNVTGGAHNQAIRLNNVHQGVPAPAAAGVNVDAPQVQPAVAEGNRFGVDDLLELVYKSVRVVFLLAAVLVYSSLERFLVVLVIVLVLFLTQFRRNQARRAGAAAEAEPQANVNNNNNGERLVANDDEDAQEQDRLVREEEPVAPPQPSGIQIFFATVYSFITSFLASLVPDNIPVDVN